MTQTDRLQLPILATGQAQKEITHNEALLLLDLLVQPVVEGGPVAAPPGSVAIGDCYLVGPGAAGEFEGNEGSMAIRTGSGWRFVSPREGFSCRRSDGAGGFEYRAGAWVETGGSLAPTTAPIASPSGGSVIDVEARAAINAIRTTLEAHKIIAE